MTLSFQLGGILIVPDRKLADHIKSERETEGEREREGERGSVLLRCVCVSFLGLRRK